MVEITAEHMDVAERCAHRFCQQRPWLNPDDVVGAALESLAKSAQRFRGDGDFTKWAVIRMFYAMHDEMRGTSFIKRTDQKTLKRGEKITLGKKRKREIATPTVVSMEQAIVGDGLTVADSIAVSERGYEEAETKLVLDGVLAQITARERFVILARRDGYSQEAIGNMLGVTSGRVCQLQRKVGKKIQDQLAA